MSEWVLWCSGVALLLLSSYWLQTRVHTLYQLMTVATAITCVCCPTARRALLTAPGICLLLLAFVLIVFAAAGHGDRIRSTAYLCVRSLPLFAIGFSIARSPRTGLRLVLGGAVAGYAMIAFYDYFFRLGGDVTQYANRQQAAVAMIGAEATSGSVDRIVGKLIYHFPTLALLSTLGLVFLDDRSRAIRLVSVMSVVLLIGAVCLSGWTAPILLVGAAYGTMGILVLFRRTTRVQSKVFILVLGTAAAFGLVALTTFLSESGSFMLAKTAERLQSIPLALLDTTTSAEKLNEVSAGRIGLAGVSLRSFLQSPLVGAGDYTIDRYASGGHSLWIDALGKYGLLGAVPLYACGFLWLLLGYRNWTNLGSTYTDLALLGALVGWTATSFLNPYLFSSTMDYTVLLMAGIITGRNYHLRSNGTRRRIRVSARP